MGRSTTDLNSEDSFLWYLAILFTVLDDLLIERTLESHIHYTISPMLLYNLQGEGASTSHTQ